MIIAAYDWRTSPKYTAECRAPESEQVLVANHGTGGGSRKRVEQGSAERAESKSRHVERFTSRGKVGALGETGLRTRSMTGPQAMVSNKEVGKRLLKVEEAARYLGLEVDTVYKKARLRELPSVKVGRALRFDVEALQRFIEQHTIETID